MHPEALLLSHRARHPALGVPQGLSFDPGGLSLRLGHLRGAYPIPFRRAVFPFIDAFRVREEEQRPVSYGVMSSVIPSGDSQSPIAPRPEARAVLFNALSREQRFAYSRALRLLVGMARSVSNGDPSLPGTNQRCIATIEREAGSPHNPTVLLDGGRGAGKTTLLLSLFADMEASQADRRDPIHARELPPIWEQMLSGDARAPRARLVPLPLIDLHTLPRGTSVLSHLVARLQLRDVQVRSSAWGQVQPDPIEELRRRWSVLANEVAIGWDGGGVQRQGAPDPESFAQDVRRGADAWRNIARAFREYMESRARWALREEPTTSGSTSVLFVAPVDDADMNPERSLEMMALLRAVSHPSLAFVLTGHSDLFLSQLRNSFLGRLLWPLKSVPAQGTSAAIASADQDAVRLATEYYDRVIPPDHRCRVPSLEFNARLEALPALNDLLKDSANHGTDPARTFNFAKVFEEAPLLAACLPDRFRGLVSLERELRLDLHEISRNVEDERLRAPDARPLWIARRLWRGAVHRASLPARATDTLLDVVALDQSARLDLHTGGVEIRTTFSEIVVYPEADDRRLLVRFPVRQLGVVAGADDGRDLNVSHGVVAAFQVVHDVVVKTGHGRFLGPTPFPDSRSDFLVRVELSSSTLLAPLRLGWPMPPFARFGRLLSYTRLLEEQLREVGRELRRDELARRLVAGGLIAFLDAPEAATAGWPELMAAALKPLRDRRSASSDGDWTERAILGAVRSDPTVAWGAVRLPLLAAPEYGLPSAVAAEILEAWSNALHFGTTAERSMEAVLREEVVRERRRFLLVAIERCGRDSERVAQKLRAEAIDTVIDKILQEFDERYGTAGHHWYRAIEASRRAAERGVAAPDPREILSRLANIPLAPSLNGASPGVLSEYIERSELRMSLLRRGAEQVAALVDRLEAFMQRDAEDDRWREDFVVEVVNVWHAMHQEGRTDLNDRIDLTESGALLLAVEPKYEDTTTEFQAGGAVFKLHQPSVRFLLDDGRRFPPAEQLFLRVLWDVSCDGHLPSNTAERANLRRALVTVSRKSGRMTHSVDWPPFHWRTLLDFDLCDQAMRSIGDALFGNSIPAGIPDLQDRIDTLAFFTLELTRSIVLHRKQPGRDSFRGAPTEAMWSNLLDGIFGTPTTTVPEHSPRLLEYYRWREKVALLAAPEYGLSISVANYITAALQRHTVVVGGRKLLEMRRRGRVQPQNVADAALRAVDQATGADHPWLKYVHTLPE